MKFTGWRVEGMGLLENYFVDELSPGLNLFLGPNEAGKTTLLEFVRGMLFGFEVKKGRPVRFPARPGLRHGGRLMVETEDGRATIERFAGKNAGVRIWFEDGRTAEEADLRRWLHNAGPDVFRNVFAIGLDELQAFETISHPGVRDRIFSAGLAGAGRSARTVIEALNNEAERWLRKRSGGVINDLLEELERKQEELRLARLEVHAYPDLVAREEQARSTREHLTAECDRLRSRQRHLEDLMAMWPEWVRRTDAQREADALLRDRTTAALRPEVEQAWRQLDLYRKRREEEAIRRAEREGKRQAATARLRALGPEWDASRVRNFDTSIARCEQTRNFRTRCEEAQRKWERALEALERAKESLAEAEAELDRARARLDASPTPDPDRLERCEEAIRIARALWPEVETHEARLKWVAEQLQRAQSSGLRKVSQAALGCGALLAFAGIALFTFGKTAAAAATIFPAAMLLLLGLLAQYGPRWVGLDPAAWQAEEADVKTRLAELKENLLRCAELLGLPFPFTPRQLEERAAGLAGERRAEAEWRRWDQAVQELTARCETARGRVQTASEAANAAQEELARVEADWAQSKAAWGVETSLSPEGMQQLLAEVERTRELLEECEALDREVRNAAEFIRSWEEGVCRLLAAAGMSGDPESGLMALRERLRRWEELQGIIASADTAIRSRVGTQADVEAFLEELASGRMDNWRSEAAAVQLDLELKMEQRDQAVRDENSARTARLALECSADIPRLEGELESLRARLYAAVRQWRVAVMARTLTETTLAYVQRERQPAVIAEAGRLFSFVTGGRFTRLLTDVEQQTLRVEMSRGEARTLDQLSRGTAEQLYLCLRLAFAAEFRRHGGHLPLVLDDVLVNFDPERARAVARMLRDYTRESQVLLFTCHPETAAILEAEAPGLRRIDLPRLGEPAALTTPSGPSGQG